MNAPRSLLADRLYRFCCDAIGAPEHLQIAEFLSASDKFVVDRRSATAVRTLLYTAPWRIEENLDMLRRPDRPLWYEWPLPTRAGHGGGDLAVTGCLVVPHPDIDTVLTFVTAWVAKKRIARHSYGSGIVDLHELSVLSFDARTSVPGGRYDGTPGQASHRGELADLVPEAADSIERMMERIAVAVPLGFQDEIAIMFNRSEGAMEGAMRDSTAEVPFVLALMLAHLARGGLAATERDGYYDLSFGPPAAPTVVERMSDAIAPAPRPLARSVGLLGAKSIRW